MGERGGIVSALYPASMSVDEVGAVDPVPSGHQGVPLDPAYRERLLIRLRLIYGEIEAQYPKFLADAAQELSDKKDSPRFNFILRRLWMERVGELHDDWRTELRDWYTRFENAMDWSVPVGSDQDEDFVAVTLSVWQKRYVTDLKTLDAIEMIRNVQNLGIRT